MADPSCDVIPTLSGHARQRCSQRCISRRLVRQALRSGLVVQRGPTTEHYLRVPGPGEGRTLAVVVRDATVVTTFWT